MEVLDEDAVGRLLRARDLEEHDIVLEDHLAGHGVGLVRAHLTIALHFALENLRRVGMRIAAARRAVHAGPQAVGGGEAVAPAPVARAKRNWYVPVSIAAVLVMSASLVMLVHEEKGDDLAQPPRSASVPSKPAESTPAPAPATAPAVPPADAEAPSRASSDKRDVLLRDAAPAKPKLAEKTAGATQATPAPEAYGELAKKQRTEKAETAADSAPATPGAARKDQGAAVVTRQQGAADHTATAPPPPASAAPQAAPAQRELKASPEPFPAQPSRDAVEARARSESDRAVTRGAVQEAPAPAAASRRTAPAVEAAPAAPPPSMADGRVMASPPVMAAPAAKPMAKPAPMVRPPPWRGLEDQPPEKWLERLAEFKRDGRLADVDELMAEFRRRFPDHPASVR